MLLFAEAIESQILDISYSCYLRPNSFRRNNERNLAK